MAKKAKEPQQDAPAYEKGEPPTYVEATKVRPLHFPAIGKIRPGAQRYETVSTDECIAHLKLIGTLADLRDVVSETDGAFGLWDITAPTTPEESNKRALALLREKRWSVFVARAVDRFESWFNACVEVQDPTPEIPHMTVSAAARGAVDPGASQAPNPFTRDSLPPLDVLMVWHAYLLNPRDFLDDCLRLDRLWFWRAGFPWEAIDQCITESLDFVASPAAVKSFTNRTGRPWDSNEEPNHKNLVCPACEKKIALPWTTTRGPGTDLNHPFEDGQGYTDGQLYCACPECKFVITHDILRLVQFRADVTDLFKRDTPLPRTVLPLEGAPQKFSNGPHTFVNRVFVKGSKLSDVRAATDFVANPKRSMDDVRALLESLLKSSVTMTYVRGYVPTTRANAREQRMSVRRMMSSYWGNASPFALDLVGAVLRQGSFVRKMDDIDWLHSPALESTMDRLIKKYVVFMEIIAKNGRRMAVPTLDVDLAWHTHQLAPLRYYMYCISHTTGKLVNHDDKVEEGALSDGFEWTCQQYHKLTGGELYTNCTCWYCEAMREATTSSVAAKMFSGSDSAVRKKAASLHRKKDSEPEKMVHISAHNAIAPRGDSRLDKRAEMRQQRLKKSYEKAQRRLAKRGIKVKQTATKKDREVADDAAFFAWGVLPVSAPMFAPVFVDSNITNSDTMYANNPACASFSDSAGNCVAGACAPQVGGGACSSGVCAGGCGVGGCSGMAGMGGMGGCGGLGGVCGGGGCGGGCGGGGN